MSCVCHIRLPYKYSSFAILVWPIRSQTTPHYITSPDSRKAALRNLIPLPGWVEPDNGIFMKYLIRLFVCSIKEPAGLIGVFRINELFYPGRRR
jgi:hypothetical protein